MSVDTQLRLNPKYEIEDIQKVLLHHLEIKSELRSCHSVASSYLIIECDNGRWINCHYNYPTPTGSALLLSMGADAEGIKILHTIAEILGGYFSENDCDEKWEDIRGMINEENGLPYFYRYAVIHNEINDDDDIEGLQESRRNWKKRIEKH